MKPRTIARLKVKSAFCVAILALVAVGTISYRAIIAFSESDRWVMHTYEVLANLNEMVAATDSFQSSDRAFALTGDESYLQSYRSAIADAKKAEKAVRDLTVDNPVQQQRLPALEELLAEKIQAGDSLIDFRRKKGLVAASEAFRGGSGQRLMIQIQDQVRAMQDEELRLLVLRNSDLRVRANETKAVLVLGTLLGVLIAFGAGWFDRRQNFAREKAEDALREGEERFSSLANNISQLAWMADKKGYIFWYNDRWFDYTGTTLEEMAGWGWQKVHDPTQVQRVVDKISRCFETGEIWEDTFPLRGRDGSYRMFLSRAVPHPRRTWEDPALVRHQHRYYRAQGGGG